MDIPNTDHPATDGSPDALALVLLPGWGNRLREARKALRLTQEALGAVLKKGHATIYKWEKERREPEYTDLVALESLLGIRVAYITHGEGPWETEAQGVAVFVMASLQKALGRKLFDLLEAPAGSHMAPTVEDGELLLLAKSKPKAGAVFFARTSTGPRVGRLFPHTEGGWVLYSDQELERPGTCFPVRVDSADLDGQVAGTVRVVKDRPRGGAALRPGKAKPFPGRGGSTRDKQAR